MGKRRSDADDRRFFDEFEGVRISRFRATGVVDPKRDEALIPMGGKTRLIATAHVKFPSGGGWSYFRCPKCGRRTPTLYLIEDKPLCCKCCEALNIKHRAQWGFGRETRRRAQDQKLDQLIAKLESKEPLRFKPVPPSWAKGKSRAPIVYNSRKLTMNMRRRMIELRLNQLASQQAAAQGDRIEGFMPIAAAKQLIDMTPIWRANTSEALQQALDKAQATILAALDSDDPTKQLNAAKLLMRTKQARERGC